MGGPRGSELYSALMPREKKLKWRTPGTTLPTYERDTREARTVPFAPRRRIMRNRGGVREGKGRPCRASQKKVSTLKQPPQYFLAMDPSSAALFAGTLAIRLGLLEFNNLELLRVGLYKVSCQLIYEKHPGGPLIRITPSTCASAPRRLHAISRGVPCRASPLQTQMAEVDEDGFSSRCVAVRYSDEHFALNESATFMVSLPMPCPDSAKLHLRLRLMWHETVEGEEDKEESRGGGGGTHRKFLPVASRTITMGASQCASGQMLYTPVCFDRDNLAMVSITVHTGLLNVDFTPPPVPLKLRVEELEGSVRGVPGSSTARFSPPLLQQHPASAPPPWLQRFLRHATHPATLEEALSPSLLKAHVEQRVGRVKRAAKALAARIRVMGVCEAALQAFKLDEEGTEDEVEDDAEGEDEEGGGAVEEAGVALELPATKNTLALEEADAATKVHERMVAPLLSILHRLEAWVTHMDRVIGVHGELTKVGDRVPSYAPSRFPRHALAHVDVTHTQEERSAPIFTPVQQHASTSEREGGVEHQQHQQQQPPKLSHGHGNASRFLTPSRVNATLVHLQESKRDACEGVGRLWRELQTKLLLHPDTTSLPSQTRFRAAAVAAVSAAIHHLPKAPFSAIFSQPLHPDLLHPHPLSPPPPPNTAATHATPTPTPLRTYETSTDRLASRLRVSSMEYGEGGSGSVPPRERGGGRGGGGEGGVHVVVFVHGMGGSMYDLRLIKAAFKLHHPTLLCFAPKSLESVSMGDIGAAGVALAEEVYDYCKPGGEMEVVGGGVALCKLSFVCFSLGGVWVRTALRHPLLSSLLPYLHTYVSIATPHLGFPPHEKGASLLSTGTFVMRSLWGKGKNVGLHQIAHGDATTPGGTEGSLLHYLGKGWDEGGGGAAAPVATPAPAPAPAAGGGGLTRKPPFPG